MMEFLRSHQMNIMLAFSGACAICALFVLISKSLSKTKKRSLFLIEVCATCMLLFEIGANYFDGDSSSAGFLMSRICNFSIFFLTIAVIYFFNMYLTDVFTDNEDILVVPKRLKVSSIILILGGVMVIISQFTGLYYTFDASNSYQRAPAFLISYIVPFLVLAIQLSFIIQYYKRLHEGIRVSLLLFPLVPIAASVIQVFTYGLILTDLAIACMVILLYMFALIDVNSTLDKTLQKEMELIKNEEHAIFDLFRQIVTAFVSAIDAKDENTKGHAARVADYAKRISIISGKSAEESEAAYFSGLLHDVGKIALPDRILRKRDNLTEDEMVAFDEHVIRGKEILNEIKEFPYLQDGAGYHHEWYDGTGFPEKLAGEDIPELARIVAVADVYDEMSSIRKDRDPLPQQIIREEVVKMTGRRLDPSFTKALIEMIDTDTDYMLREHHEDETNELENEIRCDFYRSRYTKGIPINEEVRRITFRYEEDKKEENQFSAPSIIIFDSLDGRVHMSAGSISINHYQEYGEAWFDGHMICTRARNMKMDTNEISGDTYAAPDAGEYMIEAVRVKDHIRICLTGGDMQSELIVALQDSSGFSFISITGEHCHIMDIETDTTGVIAKEGEITRIADEITYIDRMVGDVPNIQVDSYFSAATDGMSITDGMEIAFHTMTLPAANLVWHCPFLVFFKAEDNHVHGKNYEEIAIVRLDGEVVESGGSARSMTETKKDDTFENWDKWKEVNKKGYECKVNIRRKNNRIIMHTMNGGIDIKSTIYLENKLEDIKVAITGDQCALTDIRFIA